MKCSKQIIDFLLIGMITLSHCGALSFYKSRSSSLHLPYNTKIPFGCKESQLSTRHTSSCYGTSLTTHHDELLTLDDDDLKVQTVPNPLGPSHRLNHLQVGGPPLQCHRNRGGDDEKHKQFFKIHRLTVSPSMFLLKNFLAPEECHMIIEQGRTIMMKDATTTEGDGQVLRRNSRVGWIDNYADEASSSSNRLAYDMGSTAGHYLLSDEAKTSSTAGCEPLQVLHYHKAGGEFILHHDGVGRLVTVIYFLSGVGGTWFPLVTTTDDDNSLATTPLQQQEQEQAPPNNREEALAQCVHRSPGKDGVVLAGKESPFLKEFGPSRHVIPIEIGDAVAFFNYEEPTGVEGQDWRMIHAGLPTDLDEAGGEKWIATHWMHARDLLPKELIDKNEYARSI